MMFDPLTLLLDFTYFSGILEIVAALIIVFGILYLCAETDRAAYEIDRAERRAEEIRQYRQTTTENLLGPIIVYLSITQGNPAQSDLMRWVRQTYGTPFAPEFLHDFMSERDRLCVDTGAETEAVPVMEEVM